MRKCLAAFAAAGLFPLSLLTAVQTWTPATMSAPWSARGGCAAAVFGGKLWLMGGEGPGLLFDDVWNSADGDSWELVTGSAGWSARAHPSSAVFNGKLWVMGGGHSDVWNSVDGANWELVTDSAGWAGRRGNCSVVFDNKLWVMGGNAGGPLMNDVWYSSDGAAWFQADSAAPWLPRGGAASVVWRDTIWLMGGITTSGQMQFMNDVWFSADGANWTQAESAAPWRPRRGLNALAFHDTLWVMGGNGETLDFNDVWYTVDGFTWLQATPAAEWAARSAFAAAVLDDKMWVFAGWGDGGEFHDVWYTDGLGGIESGNQPSAGSSEFLGLAPNPFRGAVTASFHLPRTGKARLTIRDRAGVRIRTLAVRRQSSGTSELRWDGRDDAGRATPAGVYFLSLESDDFSATAKALKLK